MNDATHTPKNSCPGCGYEVDSASHARNGARSPTEGDYSVCLNCGAALVFRADLTVRAATKAEVERAPGDLIRVQRIIWARGEIPGRRQL